jgi:hypothetical protein
MAVYFYDSDCFLWYFVNWLDEEGMSRRGTWPHESYNEVFKKSIFKNTRPIVCAATSTIVPA